MYTKQVILCNFINVIIVMKTSLIRQPFFYKKKLVFFFTFIHVVRISFDLFSPFSLNIFYFINAEKGLGISYFNIIYALSLQFTAGLYKRHRWR